MYTVIEMCVCSVCNKNWRENTKLNNYYDHGNVSEFPFPLCFSVVKRNAL